MNRKDKRILRGLYYEAWLDHDDAKRYLKNNDLRIQQEFYKLLAISNVLDKMNIEKPNMDLVFRYSAPKYRFEEDALDQIIESAKFSIEELQKNIDNK